MNLIGVSCVLAAAFASVLPLRAQDMTIRQNSLTLGTATPGGGFPVYGEAFAAVINASDAGLQIAPRNTKGSTENIPMLETGQLDLGLVAGEPAFEALTGSSRPRSNLKILTAMYSSPGMFVVRGDSSYRTIRDLVGKPVVFGARNSGLPILARYVLDGIGLDRDKDFTAIYLDRAGDGPAMVQDGRAAALWGAGIGWPGFTAVANGAAGARFIAPDAAEIVAIRAKYPYLKPLLTPANSYPGQTSAVASVGSWSFVLVRPDLDEDTVYRLARALHRSEAVLCMKLPQACETTAASTVAAAPDPTMIHAGAQRYLREISAMK